MALYLGRDDNHACTLLLSNLLDLVHHSVTGREVRVCHVGAIDHLLEGEHAQALDSLDLIIVEAGSAGRQAELKLLLDLSSEVRV